MSTVLNYVSQFNMQGSATDNVIGASQTLNFNSLFAPLSGSHQPYGFDQIMALYTRYKVTHVDLELSFLPLSTYPVVMVWQYQPNGGSYNMSAATLDTELERPGVEFAITSITSGRPLIIRKRISIAAILGITDAELRADVTTYTGTSATAPSRSPTLQFGVGTVGLQNTVCVIARVRYHADFWDRLTVAQS